MSFYCENDDCANVAQTTCEYCGSDLCYDCDNNHSCTDKGDDLLDSVTHSFGDSE